MNFADTNLFCGLKDTTRFRRLLKKYERVSIYIIVNHHNSRIDFAMLKANYYQPPSPVDIIIFEKLVSKTHYLRRLKELISFDFVREMVSPCYSLSMGAPEEDPVLMLKLSFLHFQYNLSDRELV